MPHRDDSPIRLPVGAPVPPVTAVAPEARVADGRWIRLEPVDAARHGPVLYAASHGDAATEELWTYMAYGPFPSAAAMEEWLGQCATSRAVVYHVVVDKASGQPCGMAAYQNIVPADRRLEIGHIWYAPRAQRGVANTETAYLLVREAFDRLGYRRVEWKCNALNERSRAAARRLGFRYEGTFRAHMIVKGRNRDTAWFAMTDEDWPRVRAHFEQWLDAKAAGRELSLGALNAAR
jgi:RimJ/RimL family protein N-acetyltransferase